ncbi:dNTP triphosphohydrolase [Rhizobiaceae bacterium BDR2-2]|uniref:DNTP triphosphohydrolase n=1 Tax=Ectorhizobium quercum TaxID=2965071 RepID=A0AAE3N3Z5_9HYPH|nr:dNTP triphosphohydrolase [Ectorhizobium quercum]MCX8999806.1 dNTP triphosphohydrolase [Ectorhizobium quercum]
MVSMRWEALLDLHRLHDGNYRQAAQRAAYDQDADRITFSAPFRRLANKTQVHPLYDNDHVHHRLIHSLETASVGRTLGLRVGEWLWKNAHIEERNQAVVAGLVYAACLAHDIGNPPFGHSGEAAIGAWFAECFARGEGLFSDRHACFAEEFEAFEGNAQGFRILTRLEMYREDGGMRLTQGMLGTFVKYPVTARTRLQARDACGLKKFGLFQSDAATFATVAGATGLLPRQDAGGASWWCRHPLVFLVEAADDICYNILDLEDAFLCRDLTFGGVEALLSAVSGKKDYASGNTPQENVAYLRARAISAAIGACVEAFTENYDAIMRGEFAGALVDVSAQAENFRRIEETARERIFTSARKTELEVSGRNVVHRVLDGVLPVYEALAACDWDAGKLKGYERQLERALAIDLRNARDPFSALHSLADFVSGMTDRYSLKIARMVTGAS